MNETITLRWSTGSMELVPSALLTLSAAQLKKIVQTATLNAEEVKAEISEYIQSAIDRIDTSRNPAQKKMIANYKKLLDAVGGRKLSRVAKAAQRIYKNCNRERLQGVFEDDGKYCVCDGYRLVRFAESLDGLVKAPDSFHASNAIGNVSAYSVRLELPKCADLKADVKIAKMGRTDAGRVHYVNHSDRRMRGYYIAYDFGHGLPAVDAELLVDMLAALPDCEAFAYPDGNYKGAPVYFVSGENDGIMLTVKKDTEWEPAPVVEKPVNTAPVMEAHAEVSTDTAEYPAPDTPADIAPAPDNPAPVAPSAPVQDEQGAAVQEARQIVTAINPAFLRLFCASVRDGCRPDKTGLDRTKTDKSGVSARWTVDGRTVHNTS